MSSASAALEGIRVLDLTSGIAGPVATMHLADFGADVIKVEPAGGDPARALPGFAVWNRNKRSIVLDRSTAEGKQRLVDFLRGADMCVTGETDKDYAEALSRQYPGLVVLYMPPYAPGYTPWANGQEATGLLSAFAGPARRQSSFDGGPIDLVYPLPLYVQGQWAAGAAVAALIERLRSGFGQVVTVAGLHGMMVSCVGQLNIVPSQPPLPTNVGPGGRHPCYTTYQAQDGLWLFMAALIPKFQVNAFKVLGVDIFADERIQGIPSRMLLPENRGWIRKALADAFRTRPRDEWIERLTIGDCPAGPIGERDEWLDHPQLVANGLRVEVSDPERGQVVMPGLPIVMTASPASVRTPAPRLGEHDATATPWSPRPVPTGAPAPGRGPLKGYRVLDLGTILAGPYAGALLAELGADVVKVETPAGDAFRETGFVYNRGQRGLAVDLSSPAAREAFYALVRTSDVVLDNSRLGVPERLKIDYASLQKVKPDIITFSVNGFGLDGPIAHKPGFDPVLQAMSGMMSAQGGECDPVLFTIPVNDIAAATMGVLGVCLGIFHRERQGVGQKIWTSLLGCSAIMQSGELVRVPGRTPAVRGGCDFVGPSPLSRFYRVQDGWIRIQAADVAALQSAGVLNEFGSWTSDAALIAAISENLSGRCAAEAVACLNSSGVPAAVARMPGDLITDPQLQDLEMFATQHMRDGTPFYQANRYARFSRTQEQCVFTAPGIGEHSRSLLAEAGVSEADLDVLVASGHVKQGVPFQVVAIQNYR